MCDRKSLRSGQNRTWVVKQSPFSKMRRRAHSTRWYKRCADNHTQQTSRCWTCQVVAVATAIAAAEAQAAAVAPVAKETSGGSTSRRRHRRREQKQHGSSSSSSRTSSSPMISGTPAQDHDAYDELDHVDHKYTCMKYRRIPLH